MRLVAHARDHAGFRVAAQECLAALQGSVASVDRQYRWLCSSNEFSHCGHDHLFHGHTRQQNI